MESELAALRAEYAVTDACSLPDPIQVELTATLEPEQQVAAKVMAEHDLGILVAPPGSGRPSSVAR